MTILQWFRSVRSPRGTPGPWRPIGRLTALALLALIGLTETGCQSGFMSSLSSPCGSCGSSTGCGSSCNALKSLRQKLFNRGSSTTVIGPAVPSTVPIEGVTPGTVPGTIVTPAPAGTTLLPGPAESATTPQLDPIPSATPGPPSDAGSSPTGAKSPTGKTNYEAARPRYRGGRLVAESNGDGRNPTPEPTSLSARGSSLAPRSELDLVANLPPLELPHDARRPTAVPGPTPSEAAETAAVLAPSEINAAPIPRFTALDGRLSGGALPTNTGLDWLVEKGYKTVLDLREPSERQPSFIAEVTNRGLRYVALPISVKTVDADHLAHFHLELAMADARPLYFFDTDGIRAGVLWYIRRLTVDKVDPQIATREAEELGLSKQHKEFWMAAQSFVEKPNRVKPAPEPSKAAPASVPVPVPAPTPSPTAEPAPSPSSAPEPALAPAQGADSSVSSPTPEAPAETPAAATTSKSEESIALVALDTLARLAPVRQEPAPQVAAPAHDPTAWRPLAAMLLTAAGCSPGLSGPDRVVAEAPGQEGQSAGTGAETEIASGRVG